MRRVYGVVLAAMITVLAAGGINAVQAAHRWVAAPARANADGAFAPSGHPLRSRAGGAWNELARAERAIVFVFSPACEVSRANMANWTEVIRAAQGSGVPLFAVGPADSAAAADYWGPLAAHVRLLSTDPPGLVAALGVDVTPVTLVVENGSIRSKVEGPLRVAALAQLRELVGGAAERGKKQGPGESSIHFPPGENHDDSIKTRARASTRPGGAGRRTGDVRAAGGGAGGVRNQSDGRVQRDVQPRVLFGEGTMHLYVQCVARHCDVFLHWHQRSEPGPDLIRTRSKPPDPRRQARFRFSRPSLLPRSPQAIFRYVCHFLWSRRRAPGAALRLRA